MKYQGRTLSLSALATELLGSKWGVAGPRYFKYNGDGDLMMRALLSEDEGGLKHLEAMKMLFRKNPERMDQAYTTSKDADIVLYILPGGFVRHAADVPGIPCIRCFFNPFDKTNQFSIPLPDMKRNSAMVGFTYHLYRK